MPNPLVSVIIPAFNSEKYIAEALESVLTQTYRPIEIIVVDDGSTDGTKDIVNKYLTDSRVEESDERRNEAGDRIKLACMYQDNGGPSRARNAGIKVAKGKYVAFLDADDFWPPRKTEHQVQYMEAHPEVSLVFGDAQIFGKDGVITESIFDKYPYMNEVLDEPDGIRNCFRKLFEYDFILTGTEMFRKKQLAEVGGYDENLKQAEDTYLWLNMAAQYKVGFSRDTCLHRRLHTSNISKDYIESNYSLLKVMARIRESHPQEINGNLRAFNKKLSEIHFARGYYLFSDYQLKNARHAFCSSFQVKKKMVTLIYILSTFLPPEGVKYIRTIKEKYNNK